MKKYICLFLSSFIIFLFPIISYCATYNAYGSVTENTSQINILINTMYSQSDFSQYLDFVGIRTGDQDYSVFYNINYDNSCKRLRYYGTQSGYSTIWHLEKTDETNFAYYKNNYTVVGNTNDAIGLASYRDYQQFSILEYCIPFILFAILYFIFHVKHRNKKPNGGIDL